MVNLIRALCTACDYIDYVDTIHTVLEIIKILIEIIILVIGTMTICRYRKRTEAASFTFWSQFHAYLIEIRSWLEQGEGIVNNLYVQSLRNQEEGSSVFTSETLKDFKGRVEEVIRFIQTAENQIPAYKGFTADFNYVMRCLFDIISYDVCDPDKRFKYRDQCNGYVDPKKYVIKLYGAINRICECIENEQIKIENKISRKPKELMNKTIQEQENVKKVSL